MNDRIFYSWQSDCPSNTNRNFIGNALEKAIDEIVKDDKTTIIPVIDRDTLGVAGSPDISHAIFEKIDTASVFVCDVSIIDNTVKRPTPNPNVLIELGYAVKTLGWNRVIMVMNTKFGTPEMLPFDLRARRISAYAVAEGDDEKAPERKRLSKLFVAALNTIFENHGSRVTNDVKSMASELKTLRQVDVELFEKFKKTLPSNGSIKFIAEQNMAGFSWQKSSLDQLWTFINEWGDAEHEFIDGELEEHRLRLYKLIEDYLSQIAVNTFPASHGWQTVPPEWEENNREHFFEVVNKLHKTAEEIVKAHQIFIRIGRKKISS
ncbi:hypothetical protein NLW48_000379 [Acinetobacter baumannii]|nr:hypothetical protein [Acinetobacter baumannii]